MSAPPCLSQSTFSTDGKWEGWCWYPDRPDERAIVEVFVGNRSIRAMRAARLRTEIRDLGMGDGYCGFQLPLPSREYLTGYDIVEVRERRFARVIGRLILGDDTIQLAQELRLKSAAEALHAGNDELSTLSTSLRTRAAPFDELGAMLSRMSGRSTRSVPTHLGIFATCESRLDAVPSAELLYSAAPHVTLVIRSSQSGASANTMALARSIRETSQALRSVGAEIILLDDGEQPLVQLLPMRLRHLRIVWTSPGNQPGVGLNAAVLTARGTWLAFARPATVGTAQLLEAVRDAAAETLYLEASGSDARGLRQNHNLRCLVMRKAIHEMGGFDPQANERDMWEDLSDKARALRQSIVRWKFARETPLLSTSSARDYNG